MSTDHERTIRVTVNERPCDVDTATTVRDVLKEAGVAHEHSGIAVAMDGRVIPRRRWDEIRVEDGARIEIVTAAQGG